jgi:hypothetical protein
MSLDARTLYELLPAVYRLRDDGQGKPLFELMTLIARELGAIEESLDQLYDDQFIETCSEWVAPYIGDLVGYRPLQALAGRVSSSQAEVANTIAFRRRKGTALMLEQLARDVTGWPARAVEFFEQLATTQYMNHVRPHALATAALGSQPTMLRLGRPFQTVAHTADVRTPRSGGRYNIPNVGIFLWRLQAFRLTAVPLVADPVDTTGRRFRLNPLGADLRLFRLPRTEPGIDHLAKPVNVPDLLRIRDFALQVREATSSNDAVAQSDDYGPATSVVISRNGSHLPLRLAGPADPADPESQRVVRIADLRDTFDGSGTFVGWAHEDDIAAHHIGLDPERGRVLLGTDRAAEHASEPFVATFHYGFARALGGGEYMRTPAEALASLPQRTASGGEPLQPHLDALASTGGRLLINDSLTYAETPTFAVDGETMPEADGRVLVIAARSGARPLIAAAGPMSLNVGARGTLVLDGLVISGGALHLAAAADNEPRTVVLRDCTLVPGLTLNTDGTYASPGAPSIIVEHPFTTILLERCITGPLRIAAASGVTVELQDSIVDAGSPESVAYGGETDDRPGAEIILRECTIVGRLFARMVRLASNCIFFARLPDGSPPAAAPIHVQRRQEGCLRFCFVPSGSIVPRRHRCQPEANTRGILPHFTSLRYGDPGYCQLRNATPTQIRHGADDEGEMGVMHALFQPQRETNLRIRLDEYLRFGLRAGLIYET